MKLVCVAAVAIAVVAGTLWASRGFPGIEGLGFSRDDSRATAADVEKLLAVEGSEGRRVDYLGYTVSFNPDLRIPDYVVYELTRQETEGEEERARHFERDERVEGCPQPSDYTRSGYDRGHMAPAADMKWSEQAMRESFYMTNICPQNHALNAGAWKRLEEKTRDWAERDSALVVVSGPIVSGNPARLPSGVAVPEGFFKVLLAPFANPIRGIAFIYKNEGGQKRLEQQAVSIDEVETATGLDFFSSLPDELENRIEESCNFNEWND